MHTPEPAKSRSILLKRLNRLLRLDQGPDDKSELSLRIMPFLNSLGSTVLIGGAIRDVARAGKRAFYSDLDFVVYGGDRDQFVVEMNRHNAIRNKFGGYGLRCFQLKVDVWHIEDTWAKTAGLVDVKTPEDLLHCTFFDWDSIIYDISDRKLVFSDNYLERLQRNVMDIRLEENPNPHGSLIRALRRAAQWRVKFGPRLTAFSKKCLRELSWQELVSLDTRAFQIPILKDLDRSQILARLDAPVCILPTEVTLPVPNWTFQLELPFGNGPMTMESRTENTA